MTDNIKVWHFVENTLRDGQIKICASGLHASLRPWDALQYAPGSALCYVECRGDVQQQSDKLVCREHRIIMRADVTQACKH